MIETTSAMYDRLIRMSGELCYTLTNDKAARMTVDASGITIGYDSGNALHIPRAMVIRALDTLRSQGRLSVDDVHLEITDGNGARTDRLMASIRKLPGVTSDKRPRMLYLNR